MLKKIFQVLKAVMCVYRKLRYFKFFPGKVVFPCSCQCELCLICSLLYWVLSNNIKSLK